VARLVENDELLVDEDVFVSFRKQYQNETNMPGSSRRLTAWVEAMSAGKA